MLLKKVREKEKSFLEPFIESFNIFVVVVVVCIKIWILILCFYLALCSNKLLVMSALQLLTMLQLKRKLMAYSFIIYSWEFFDITSIFFDLLDYSNKLRGHMQTNTA